MSSTGNPSSRSFSGVPSIVTGAEARCTSGRNALRLTAGQLLVTNVTSLPVSASHVTGTPSTVPRISGVVRATVDEATTAGTEERRLTFSSVRCRFPDAGPPDAGTGIQNANGSVHHS